MEKRQFLLNLRALLEKRIKDEGGSLLKQHKFDEAIDYFNGILSIDHFLAYHGLGEAIFRKASEGDVSSDREPLVSSMGYLTKSIERNPEFHLSYLMRGLAGRTLGDILYRELKENRGGADCKQLIQIFQRSNYDLINAMRLGRYIDLRLYDMAVNTLDKLAELKKIQDEMLMNGDDS